MKIIILKSLNDLDIFSIPNSETATWIFDLETYKEYISSIVSYHDIKDEIHIVSDIKKLDYYKNECIYFGKNQEIAEYISQFDNFYVYLISNSPISLSHVSQIDIESVKNNTVWLFDIDETLITITNKIKNPLHCFQLMDIK